MGTSYSTNVAEEDVLTLLAASDARISQLERNVADLLRTAAENGEACRVAQEAQRVAEVIAADTKSALTALAHVHATALADAEWECPVCLKGGNKCAMVPCGHLVCTDCSLKLKYRNCCMCKRSVDTYMRVFV